MVTGGESIPRSPGIYALWLVASAPASIEVGKLGTVYIAPGRAYIYVGSAMGGLASRLGRHLSTAGKKKHWHIDYLLEHLHVRGVFFARTTTRKECEISRAINDLASHFTPVDGFGNSDCKTCKSHLYEGSAIDEEDLIADMLGTAFRSSGLQPEVAYLAKN